MSVIPINRKGLAEGRDNDSKTTGMLSAHLDERDIHCDKSRIHWVAPIGFTTSTTAMGHYMALSLAGGTGTVSLVNTSGGFVRLYCSAASGSFMGIGRSGACIRSDAPSLEVAFRVESLGGQRFHFELYKDSDEYITVRVASGGAVEYVCNDKSGAASGAWAPQDDGLNDLPSVLTVAKDTWYRMTLGVNDSGKPFLINHGSDGSRDVYTLKATDSAMVITTGLHYPQAKVYSTAGGVAVANIKAWDEGIDKL